MNKNQRFLKACRGEAVDATPIWLMRQAGRYMAEYRDLRKSRTILEMIKDPALAAEVTLQPIRAFDLDAAIIFADILTLLESMGLPLEFISGKGPIISDPIRTVGDVDRLRTGDAQESMEYTLEAIRLVQQDLAGRIPLIGFSGAPFTLACYAIAGGSSKDYAQVKAWMRTEPKAWHKLMALLAEAVGDYLAAQAEAGADTLQLFDSWAGILGPHDYREYVLPHSRAVLDRVRTATDVPLIHFGTGTGGILKDIHEAGGDVIGVDWRISMTTARDILGPDVTLQGNLDPTVLLTSPDIIQSEAARVLDEMGGQSGHIFNLGHGIFKETPVEHVACLVDFVHEHSAKR